MTSIAEGTETAVDVELDSRGVYAAILNRAADEIDKRGWTTGLICAGGPVCALGGIVAATGRNPSRETGYDKTDACYMAVVGLVADAVFPDWQAHVHDPLDAVYYWNDGHVEKLNGGSYFDWRVAGTGAAEVPARLRAIAAELSS